MILIDSNAAQHSVHPTGGSLRVFKQFARPEVGSVKMALSHPTHQRVTQAVGQPQIDIHSGPKESNLDAPTFAIDRRSSLSGFYASAYCYLHSDVSVGHT